MGRIPENGTSINLVLTVLIFYFKYAGGLIRSGILNKSDEQKPIFSMWDRRTGESCHFDKGSSS